MSETTDLPGFDNSVPSTWHPMHRHVTGALHGVTGMLGIRLGTNLAPAAEYIARALWPGVSGTETPTVVHHWRITGQSDGDHPRYDFTWASSDDRWPGRSAELYARRFLRRVTGDWTDVAFTHRTVTYGPWEDANRKDNDHE